MLNLKKGEYCGHIVNSFAEEGLIIAITQYEGETLKSPLHSHDNAHLSFCLRGEMVVGRKKHTGIHTVSERFSYIRPGEEHQTSMPAKMGKNINLELEPGFLRLYALKESHLEKMSTLPGASLTMLRLFNELSFNGAGLEDNLHVLILSMLQDRYGDNITDPPVWVKLVRELLHDNWNQEISLKEIATLAGVHPVTISKYFTRYFACTLGEYRRRLKLERALPMISSTNRSLTKIAYACGFYDQSHFIRAFKASTNLLPSHLRTL